MRVPFPSVVVFILGANHLSSFQTRHTLDPHLFVHLPSLLTLTRTRLVTLYFAPFSTIKLDRMATAFGWSIADTEDFVVDLVRKGEIVGRVDSREKVLRVRRGGGKKNGGTSTTKANGGSGERKEVWRDVVRNGVKMASLNRKLVYRMKLSVFFFYFSVWEWLKADDVVSLNVDNKRTSSLSHRKEAVTTRVTICKWNILLWSRYPFALPFYIWA
jgi:hypothetical protein